MPFFSTLPPTSGCKIIRGHASSKPKWLKSTKALHTVSLEVLADTKAIESVILLLSSEHPHNWLPFALSPDIPVSRSPDQISELWSNLQHLTGTCLLIFSGTGHHEAQSQLSDQYSFARFWAHSEHRGMWNFYRAPHFQPSQIIAEERHGYLQTLDLDSSALESFEQKVVQNISQSPASSLEKCLEIQQSGWGFGAALWTEKAQQQLNYVELHFTNLLTHIDDWHTLCEQLLNDTSIQHSLQSAKSIWFSGRYHYMHQQIWLQLKSSLKQSVNTYFPDLIYGYHPIASTIAFYKSSGPRLQIYVTVNHVKITFIAEE